MERLCWRLWGANAAPIHLLGAENESLFFVNKESSENSERQEGTVVPPSLSSPLSLFIFPI
jgi:hypothetical protein